MNIAYYGNIVAINYSAGDTSPLITLPDGYSYNKIVILNATNINFILNNIPVKQGVNETIELTFPPINSKSPCLLHPTIVDSTKAATLRILITKFGQIPDVHYFDSTFEPILVTGDDGKEYNIIPSDQFKQGV